MTNKSCKLKLCECFGMAQDTKAGKKHRYYLQGVEAGMLNLLDILNSNQEDELLELAQDVGDADSEEGLLSSIEAMVEFGMKVAS